MSCARSLGAGGRHEKPAKETGLAFIEKSKEFTLVPWRPVLERWRGKMVGGIMRGSSVSFDFGKKRGAIQAEPLGEDKPRRSSSSAASHDPALTNASPKDAQAFEFIGNDYGPDS